MFSISLNQDKDITQICSDYQQHSPYHYPQGVNPIGPSSNQLWQMGATHIPTFGLLQWVHVTTIDTYSGFIWQPHKPHNQNMVKRFPILVNIC
jgi:hypothetical protein